MTPSNQDYCIIAFNIQHSYVSAFCMLGSVPGKGNKAVNKRHCPNNLLPRGGGGNK